MGEVRVFERQEEPFYTIGSLARRLSVSERTVKRWIKERKIASYDLEGIRRIDPADVNSLLAQHREDRRDAA